MNEKIQRRVIDTGHDGEYRVTGDLKWCEEHKAWEAEWLHNAVKKNPELLKEIDED